MIKAGRMAQGARFRVAIPITDVGENQRVRPILYLSENIFSVQSKGFINEFCF